MRRARAGLRDRWVSEVLTANVTDACKVVLFAMSTRMTDVGYVSIPRSELAEMVGRHPARVSERIAEAKAAGLLGQVGGGFRGRTAEYVAQLVNGYGQPVTISRNHSETQQAGKVTASRLPNTRARARARTTESERSEHDAVHDPAGSQDAHVEVSTRTRCADRYGVLQSTRQAGRRLTRVVEAPSADGSAETHDLTARLRASGVYRARARFAWTTGAAA